MCLSVIILVSTGVYCLSRVKLLGQDESIVMMSLNVLSASVDVASEMPFSRYLFEGEFVEEQNNVVVSSLSCVNL